MLLIEDGKLNSSTISSNWVYVFYGLWCEVLDKLGNTTWQTQLNNQTTEKTVTLYDLIKEIIIK